MKKSNFQFHLITLILDKDVYINLKYYYYWTRKYLQKKISEQMSIRENFLRLL